MLSSNILLNVAFSFSMSSFPSQCRLFLLNVIPTKAGIQALQMFHYIKLMLVGLYCQLCWHLLDSRLRGNDIRVRE